VVKRNIILVALCFPVILGYSQYPIKDPAIAFTSDQIKLSYTPTDLVTSISVASVKFANGENGIKFFFMLKPRENPPGAMLNNMILKSSTGKMLTLNSPFKDTLYYLNDHGLSITTIQRLDKQELETLKEELITTIILIADEKQVLINLRKKSQKNFREWMRQN
jgi:hypothetical protein